MPMNARLLRPRATGFNPKSIAGLSLWLDASDASTLRQNSDGSVAATAHGDPVGYWGDKSGNNHHLTQATAGLRGMVFTSSGRTRVDIPTTLNAGFASATSPTTSSTATVIQAARFQGAFGNWLTILRGDGSAFFDAASSGVAISPNLTAGSPSYFVQGLPTTATRAALYSALNEANAVLSVTDINLSTWSSGWRYYNFGSSFQFTGEVGEVLVYNRALTASERQRIEAYLARKWSISLPPQVSNAEAQDWVNRVYANGGSVSASTASAVNTFCNAIDTAGIRDRFYRLNLFAGTGLSACLVPLYRGQSRTGTQYGNATDTNNGPFVSGDYAETGTTGGLKGNGSTKYLDTGLAGNTFSAGDRHCSAYWNANSTITGNRVFIGNTDSSATAAGMWFDIHSRHTNPGSEAQITNNHGLTHTAANRHQLAQYTGATDASSYSDGGNKVTRSSFIAAPTASASNWFVFGINPGLAGGARTDARICNYSVGLSMTDANALAFYNAVHAFQTALTRQA